jgi:dTDP-4-amino-4,6-dideoxygalactose transaminase
MQIPLVDLKQQYHTLQGEILSALSEVMENSSFVKGPKLEEFERNFASYHGASECVGVNSGTDALFLILKALDVKPGDEIITVPFTFFATAEAIVNAGAGVVFCDVDSERYTLDPSQLEALITPRTVGIVLVHLYGMPADMDPILKISQKNHLWVVEDACQSHGAVYKGKRIGTFGAASAFSFYPSKNLGAYGDGGAVLTNSKELASQIRKLQDHGQSLRYHSEIVGYNSRLDAMQAAILKIKLKHLDEWNEKRRKAAAIYSEKLASIKQVKTPKQFPDSKEVFHLYVIQAEKRDELSRYLEKAGISVGIHYGLSLHHQPPFKNSGTHLYPVSEKLSQTVLSLPIFPEISEAQISYVVEQIRKFYS